METGHRKTSVVCSTSPALSATPAIATSSLSGPWVASPASTPTAGWLGWCQWCEADPLQQDCAAVTCWQCQPWTAAGIELLTVTVTCWECRHQVCVWQFGNSLSILKLWSLLWRDIYWVCEHYSSVHHLLLLSQTNDRIVKRDIFLIPSLSLWICWLWLGMFFSLRKT